MLRKHMAACLVATAFAATPALAQNPPPPSGGTDRPVSTGTGSTTTGSSAMQPSTGPAAGATGAAPTAPMASSAAPPPGGASSQFMTQIQPDQVMVSKLIGTTVVGPNNESIGDVNDVIVDRKGQAMAVVIGVGGFLGIGEKDVAVPFQQLEFTSGRQGNQQASGSNTGGGTATSGAATSANNATNSTVNTTGSTGTAQQDSATNRSTATTGNTGNAGSGPGAAGGSDSNVPDRIMLRMTKAELQSAPTFTGSSRNQNAGGSGGATAPKP